MPGIDNRKENGYQAFVVIDRPIGNGLYSFHNVLRVLSGADQMSMHYNSDEGCCL